MTLFLTIILAALACCAMAYWLGYWRGAVEQRAADARALAKCAGRARRDFTEFVEENT